MVHREDRSQFVGIIGRLVETVTAILQYMIHIDIKRHLNALLSITKRNPAPEAGGTV
jgi:hypothetical protein